MASDGAPSSKDHNSGNSMDRANSAEFLDSANASSLLTNNIATFSSTLSPKISSTRYRSDGSSIFSTPPNSNSNPTPLDSPELPEKVRHFTSEFCAEFKRLMDSFGDKVVENLTPMTIEVLEQLQEVITANQRAVDEIDMLREDKQQLITQYEREKQSRWQSEQRLMSLEDETAVVESESQRKLDELESVVRVLELRAKNEADHAVRLEEREGEIKKDYQKLHDKYTELWRTHADNIDRTKILLGPSAEELLQKAKAVTIKEARMMLLESAKENVMLSESSSLAAPSTPRQFSTQSSVNTPVSGSGDRAHRSPNPALNNMPQREIVEELSFDEEIASRSMDFEAENERKFGEETGDSGALEVSESYDGEEPPMEHTGSLRHEIEEGLMLPSLGNAMSREIDNLIAENKELLDIKNALNIVKNDLLTRVEELGGEVTIRDDELNSVRSARDKYKQRLHESEEKFRTMRDGYEQKLKEYFKKEEDVPNAEQKRFTRAEMHKLIQERNRYKEQLMELQDQIRWRERGPPAIIHNAPVDNSRGGIWSYFRSLFKQPSPLSGSMPTSQSSMTLSAAAAAGPLGGVSLHSAVNRRSSTASSATLPANTSSPSKSAVTRARGSDLTLGSSKSRGVSPAAHSGSVNPFADGRVEAFGWSVPQSHVTPATTTAPIINNRGSNNRTKPGGGGDVAYKSAIENANLSGQASSAAVLNRNVPVPVHCRPIEHCDSGMKIWCATGVDLTPARSRDGNLMVGLSVLLSTTTSVGFRSQQQQQQQQPRRTLAYRTRTEHSVIGNTKHDAGCPSYADGSTSRYLAALKHAAGSDYYSNDGWSLLVPPTQSFSLPSTPKFRERQRTDSNSSMQSNRHKLNSNDGSEAVVVSGKTVAAELKEFEMNLEAFQTSSNAAATIESSQQQLSSYVWLCSSTHSMSQVSVIDADRPDHVLASFSMHSTQLLCCVSVPGVQPAHYPTRAQMDFLTSAKSRTIQRPNITSKLDGSSPAAAHKDNVHAPPSRTMRDLAAPLGSITFVKCSTGNEPPPTSTARPSVAEPGTPTAKTTTFNITQVDANYVNSSKLIQSFEPTVWLGGQNGVIYVHSAVKNNNNSSGNWSERLFRIQLQDSIITMVHCRGRMFVACADGQVAVFHRYSREAVGASPALEHVKEMHAGEEQGLNTLEGFWDIGSYHLIDIGKPQHSVRCMCVVADDAVWACYRNKVHVLDPITLRVRATFDAHPREESSVRNLAWYSDGVWLSIRLDSTLRLFHAHTYEHLQDVDVEPFVGCMLRANRTLGFTLIRITALLIVCKQLWIGTSNGVIVSVPLSDDATSKRMQQRSQRNAIQQQSQSLKTAIFDAADTANKAVAALTGDNVLDAYVGGSSTAGGTTSSIPFCAITDARISCLGHKDVVKFFVAVPATGVGASETNKVADNVKAKANTLPGEQINKQRPSSVGASAVLVMSGGEGCVDFRHPDNDNSTNAAEKENFPVTKDAETDKPTPTGDEAASAVDISASSGSNKTDDIVNALSSSTQNSRTASGGDMSHLLMWSLTNA